MNAALTLPETLETGSTRRGTDPPRRSATRPRRIHPSAFPLPSSTPPAPPASSLEPAAYLRRRLPPFAPLLEELELAGWTQYHPTAASFHDWLPLDDGRVLLLAGHTHVTSPTPDPRPINLSDHPQPSTLNTQLSLAAWAAVRAHALHTRDAGHLLSLSARTLWPNPELPLATSLAVALVDTIGGRVSLASAGDCLIWRIRAATCEQLPSRQPPLGATTDCAYQSHTFELSLRERLLLIADNPTHRSPRLATSIISDFAHANVETHRRMSAADVVNEARMQCERTASLSAESSTSIVAVRRR